MKIIPTLLHDVFLIEPIVFQDERGFIFESYQKQRLAEAGIHANFVQDNHSRSNQGTLRGWRQVFYDLIENRAERAERIAEAASAHMAQHGNMRGFKANKVGGEIKGVVSPAGRSLGAPEQAELRKIIDAAAAGGDKARAALKSSVQAGWVLY